MSSLPQLGARAVADTSSWPADVCLERNLRVESCQALSASAQAVQRDRFAPRWSSSDRNDRDRARRARHARPADALNKRSGGVQVLKRGDFRREDRAVGCEIELSALSRGLRGCPRRVRARGPSTLRRRNRAALLHPAARSMSKVNQRARIRSSSSPACLAALPIEVKRRILAMLGQHFVDIRGLMRVETILHVSALQLCASDGENDRSTDTRTSADDALSFRARSAESTMPRSDPVTSPAVSFVRR